MKEIQQQLLNRAISTLNALQVSYKIITEDGEYGTLEVVKSKPSKKVKRVRRITYGNYIGLYRDTLANMKIGDVEQFPVALIKTIEGSSVSAFRSALVASACTLWGKGNFASTITKENVEIMRLG